MSDPVSQASKNLAQHITAHVRQLILLERTGVKGGDFVQHATDMLALQIELASVANKLHAAQK